MDGEAIFVLLGCLFVLLFLLFLEYWIKRAKRLRRGEYEAVPMSDFGGV